MPGGSYQTVGGDQQIVVQGETIRFVVRLDSLKTILHDCTFPKHSIWPNGHIQAFPMREAESVLGVGKFDWTWNGTNIISVNVATGEKLIFSHSK